MTGSYKTEFKLNFFFFLNLGSHLLAFVPSKLRVGIFFSVKDQMANISGFGAKR